MYGECRVAIPKPAGHAHDAGAQRNLRERAHDLHHSHRTVARAENKEQRKKVKERRERRGQSRPAILHAPEEYFEEKDVQHDIDDQRDGSDDHRRLRILCGVKCRHDQLHRRQRGQADGVIEQRARR